MRILDFADGFSSASAPSLVSLVTVGSVQTIGSGGEISFEDTAFQIIKVQGDGGAQTASNTPFGTASAPGDGSIIYVMGMDNTNTFTIPYQDIAGGCILTGPATLGKYDILKLYRDKTEDRYIELGRNH